MRTSQSGGLLNSLSSWIVLSLLCLATTLPSLAQTFTTLVIFDGINGKNPYYGPLVQGRDGNLYGTTYVGGSTGQGFGNIFKMTPATGTAVSIYYFCPQQSCTDGEAPAAGLALGTDGNFYGTTNLGGNVNCGFPYGCGTVFKVTSGGTLTTLNIFPNGGGAGPLAGVTLGTSGKFYGTTGPEGGDGTVFSITTGGALNTILYLSTCTEGCWPLGGLTLGVDGNFYGTTSGGGTSLNCNDGCGTVFKITPAGKLTTLHSFDLADGASPVGGLVQAANGNFYGTTAAGGNNLGIGTGACGQASNDGCGTIFEITPAGHFTTIYNFCALLNCADGANPYGTLVQGADGNFYGTTYLGGVGPTNNGGTLFQFNPISEQLSVLHTFCSLTSCADGSNPLAGLVQDTDGNFYGTTYYGGGNCNYGCGTIFRLSMGLSPFVEAVTYSGKVGSTIEFLGQGFTSSTTVSFNGTHATRTVKSGTYLTATVPSGATTGLVTVTTSGGTLTSNKTFRVVPQIQSFNPTSGPVSTVVTITGVSLTRASRVSFAGKAAPFAVISDTKITATVPAGAKTGRIAITTPGGTATSTLSYTVTP